MDSQQLLSSLVGNRSFRLNKSNSTFSLRSTGTNRRRDTIREDILNSFDEGVEREKRRLKELQEAEEAKLLNSAIFEEDEHGNKVVCYLIHRPWPASSKRMTEHLNRFQKKQIQMSDKIEREFNEVKDKLSKIYEAQYNRQKVQVLTPQQRTVLDQQIEQNRKEMDAIFGQQVFLFETQGEIQEPKSNELLTMSCSQYTIQ